MNTSTLLPKLASIAEALKTYHNGLFDECPGPGNCQVIPIIDSLDALMTEIATASKIEQDPEFQAVVTQGMLAAADPSDIAHAAIRAAQQIGARFMPETRLCVECDSILPSTTPSTMNRCQRCAQ